MNVSTATLFETRVQFDSFQMFRPRELSFFSGQIEDAVSDFVTSCGVVKVDLDGFRQQTLKTIAQMVSLPGSGDFWLVLSGSEDSGYTVAGYVIARPVLDIDDKLCYWISQAWVHRDFRGRRVVKDWLLKLRVRAKELFCSHIVYVASRNPKAYKRFLGPDVHDYATILKEDLK